MPARVGDDGGVRHDGDFAAYLAARWPAIVRSLVLLGCARADAETIAHEGLARCYLDWDRVREADDIDVQVYGAVLDVRARRRVAEDATAGAEPPDDDPTQAAAVLRALERALGRLSEQDRALVVLRYSAGLSPLQVAELLEMREPVVRYRIGAVLAGLDLPALREAAG
jgi:hypothetical protein